mgnify:FL=1
MLANDPDGRAMLLAQVYCTAQQVCDDLKLTGFTDPSLMERIRGASEVIRHKGGEFLPVLEARVFRMPEGKRNPRILGISPCLEVVSIFVGDEQVVDFTLRPRNRCWEGGPYVEIEIAGCWPANTDITITGVWGKYEQAGSLGITASQATGIATDLEVENGSLLSAGMVLKIEDEFEFVVAGAGSKGSPAPTTSPSSLEEAIDEHSKTLEVTSGSDFLAGETIQIGVEDMKVLKVSGDLLAVSRGWNNTNADAHAAEDAIGVYRTFLVERGVNGSEAAAHTSAEVYQMQVPDTVNYLCRQIAALMKMKADSGFTGITGDSEMGQGRYLSEFPPKTIETVLEPFRAWEY